MHFNVGNGKESEQCTKKAFELRHRLPARERLGIEGNYYTSQVETLARGISAYEEVLELFPDAFVEYRFKNRGSHRFPPDFASIVEAEIKKMASLSLTDKEFDFLGKIPFFKPWYNGYLRNFRFDPAQVQLHVDNDGQLQLSIAGPWHSTILWEVPLMAVPQMYGAKSTSQSESPLSSRTTPATAL